MQCVLKPWSNSCSQQVLTAENLLRWPKPVSVWLPEAS